MAWIFHPVLNVSSEVHDEAVPAWQLAGWQVTSAPPIEVEEAAAFENPEAPIVVQGNAADAVAPPKPVEEAPVEEAPVEATPEPVVEAPVDEPVADAPVVDAPVADSTPAEDTTPAPDLSA